MPRAQDTRERPLLRRFYAALASLHCCARRLGCGSCPALFEWNLQSAGDLRTPAYGPAAAQAAATGFISVTPGSVVT